MKMRLLALSLITFSLLFSCRAMREKKLQEAWIRDSIEITNRLIEARFNDSIAAMGYHDDEFNGDYSGDFVREYEGFESAEEPQPVYQPARTRAFDLLHTRLEVSFDWAKAQMPGKAWLKLKPYFYATKELVLDAKGFEMKRVALVTAAGLTDLQFKYDSLKLTIQLGREYKRTEEVQVYIEYIAKPNDRPQGGSEAITGDKGLYFINPDGSEPGKPRQLWTQGETEASSCWFPTIDAPNERCTQELAMTVDKQFVTLSNGLLVKQVNNPDGTRTDYWKMDQPHAPYLFMMAVGDWAVVKDKLGAMEVSYYVEKKYEPYARLIFGNTPEMIKFFGERLGVAYPWPKFSQVVVRDFVSGAMENTTAVVHFSNVAHDARDHVDETYEDIISHELFHHWFGDLVTCESWSNISLNESFATYGEFLWREYKYGSDDALHHLQADQSSYYMESMFKEEELIRYYYADKEEVFDGHSYQKGACILHMLRKAIGDDAFFEGLKLYLTRHAFSDAEAHELRLAFEDVTGQDLNWFFNQWYFRSGHPKLYVSTEIEDSGRVNLYVRQNQDYDSNFEEYGWRLHFNVEFVTGDQREWRELEMTNFDTSYKFTLSQKPDYIVFNADGSLLATVEEDNKEDSVWIQQLKRGSNYVQRQQAAEGLKESLYSEGVIEAWIETLQRPFWADRHLAVGMLARVEGDRRDTLLPFFTKLATTDPDARVRDEALSAMESFVNELDQYDETEVEIAGRRRAAFIDVLSKCLNDSSRTVQGHALTLLYKADPQVGAKAANSLMPTAGPDLAPQIAEILISEKDPGAMNYVRTVIKEAENGFTKYNVINSLAEYMEQMSGDQLEEAIQVMKDFAASKEQWWQRGVAVRALGNYLEHEDVIAFLKERKQVETNADLKEAIEELVGAE